MTILLVRRCTKIAFALQALNLIVIICLSVATGECNLADGNWYMWLVAVCTFVLILCICLLIFVEAWPQKIAFNTITFVRLILCYNKANRIQEAVMSIALTLMWLVLFILAVVAAAKNYGSSRFPFKCAPGAHGAAAVCCFSAVLG